MAFNLGSSSSYGLPVHVVGFGLRTRFCTYVCPSRCSTLMSRQSSRRLLASSGRRWPYLLTYSLANFLTCLHDYPRRLLAFFCLQMACTIAALLRHPSTSPLLLYSFSNQPPHLLHSFSTHAPLLLSSSSTLQHTAPYSVALFVRLCPQPRRVRSVHSPGGFVSP